MVSPRVDTGLEFVYQGPDPTSPRKLVPRTFVSGSFAGFTRSPGPFGFGLELRVPVDQPLGAVIDVFVAKYWDLAT